MYLLYVNHSYMNKWVKFVLGLKVMLSALKLTRELHSIFSRVDVECTF